jgi:hypothetical protein
MERSPLPCATGSRLTHRTSSAWSISCGAAPGGASTGSSTIPPTGFHRLPSTTAHRRYVQRGGPRASTGLGSQTKATTPATPVGSRSGRQYLGLMKRGCHGERFTYNCPAGFEFRSVARISPTTDIARPRSYRPDCATGAALTTEIRPRESYGSTRNGDHSELRWILRQPVLINSLAPIYPGTVCPADDPIGRAIYR